MISNKLFVLFFNCFVTLTFLKGEKYCVKIVARTICNAARTIVKRKKIKPYGDGEIVNQRTRSKPKDENGKFTTSASYSDATDEFQDALVEHFEKKAQASATEEPNNHSKRNVEPINLSN